MMLVDGSFHHNYIFLPSSAKPQLEAAAPPPSPRRMLTSFPSSPPGSPLLAITSTHAKVLPLTNSVDLLSLNRRLWC